MLQLGQRALVLQALELQDSVNTARMNTSSLEAAVLVHLATKLGGPLQQLPMMIVLCQGLHPTPQAHTGTTG